MQFRRPPHERLFVLRNLFAASGLEGLQNCIVLSGKGAALCQSHCPEAAIINHGNHAQWENHTKCCAPTACGALSFVV